LNIKPPRASLVWTLALAYLGLALLAAVTVRLLSLSVELRSLDRDLAAGRLERATAQAAAQLTADLPLDARSDPALVQRRLDSGLHSIEASLSDMGHAGILSELANPIAMQVQDPSGRILARIGRIDSVATGPVPAPKVAVVRVPTRVQGGWRYLAPLRDRGGVLAGLLTVELTRHPPGLEAMMGDGFEWPALLVYAGVFTLGSALVLQLTVTRRLRAMAGAADAWSRGDFSHSVADESSDEIGSLSRRLDQMARELEALVTLRAELAGMNERQRLARDLHDTVKQKAFALQLQLAAVERAPSLAPGIVRTLEDARGITREIQEELAHLIGDTAASSDEPFDHLLRERAEAWGRRGGFKVRADLAAALVVPPPHRPVLARVLDEALANVMRHSGAGTADVRLSERAGRFEFIVQDDGRGLRMTGDGMGLRNMRRRAAELPDGALDVAAGDRGGARVTLSWSRPIVART
jgi:signal transduction histidine kinase